MSRLATKATVSIWKDLRFLYLFAGVVFAITVSNVMKSSWSGDDWPNSQTPYWVKWRYGSLTPAHIWYEAQYWNNQWMQGQGRFYPISWIESRFAFSYLRELWQYKLLEAGVLFAAGVLFVLLIYKLSRSHSLALLLLLMMSISIQFRRDFDPHIAFVFMVPSLLAKVFLSSILSYHAARTLKQFKGILISIAAGIVLFVAMSSYEYAFLLFPIVLVSFFMGNLHRREFIEPTAEDNRVQSAKAQIAWRLLPIVASWIGYAVFVFAFLRTKAAAISGAYVLSISMKSVPTFFSQLVPPLPLSVFKMSDITGQTTTWALIISALLVALLGMYFLYALFAKSFTQESFDYLEKSPSRRTLLVVFALIALDLLLSPPFMLSIQPEWWGRANVTHSYLGVLIQEFGSALVLSLLLSFFISQNVRRSNPRSNKRGVRK
jgi:Na+-transporting methylmalonyl-CoA/oxaloacetate decarboxylase gamma subunit